MGIACHHDVMVSKSRVIAKRLRFVLLHILSADIKFNTMLYAMSYAIFIRMSTDDIMNGSADAMVTFMDAWHILPSIQTRNSQTPQCIKICQNA